MKRYHIHFLVVCFLFGFLSCGKKGPLEPPVIRIPKDIELLVLKQRGGNVFLQWRNPTHYIDGNPIREISQVEIWILEKDRQMDPSQEPVTGKDFKREGKLLIAIPEKAFVDYSIPGSTGSPVLQFVHSLDKDFLIKNYFFSFRVVDVRRRKSPYSEPVLFKPSVLPLPPLNVHAEVSEDRIIIHWDPPVMNIDQSVPPVIGGYNLFRSEDGRTTQLNSNLILNLEYEDTDFVFETTYIYTVRTAASQSVPALESENSEGLTVIPKDIFPPAPPEGLVAVSGADVLSLSWEPKREPDFKGYRVWRRAENESDFVVLTPEPILENAYTDVSVEKNLRYHYAITAMDDLGNESRRSSEVTEILREGLS
jgi:hypothetical protein